MISTVNNGFVDNTDWDPLDIFVNSTGVTLTSNSPSDAGGIDVLDDTLLVDVVDPTILDAYMPSGPTLMDIPLVSCNGIKEDTVVVTSSGVGMYLNDAQPLYANLPSLKYTSRNSSVSTSSDTASSSVSSPKHHGNRVSKRVGLRKRKAHDTCDSNSAESQQLTKSSRPSRRVRSKPDYLVDTCDNYTECDDFSRRLRSYNDLLDDDGRKLLTDIKTKSEAMAAEAAEQQIAELVDTCTASDGEDSKDVKKRRRLLRNRISAQLHREKKRIYLETLELEFVKVLKEVKDLRKKTRYFG